MSADAATPTDADGQPDTRTCESCGSPLRFVTAHGHGTAVYDHYRCPDCRAGGTVVKARATDATRRLLGPAVDASYSAPGGGR